MKTALILHGILGKAGDHWEGWLKNELIKRDYVVIMPTLPHSKNPDRGEWLATVKGLLEQLELSELVIIGHSIGAVTALDYIEQTKGSIRALIAVSGFPYDYGSALNDHFMKEKQIDFIKVKKHSKQTFVVYGDDDPYVPQFILHNLARELGVLPKVIHKGGHLNTESGFTTFMYLLEIIDALQ